MKKLASCYEFTKKYNDEINEEDKSKNRLNKFIYNHILTSCKRPYELCFEFKTIEGVKKKKLYSFILNNVCKKESEYKIE